MEEQDVDGRIILKWIFRKWDEGMDWIGLTKDRDRGAYEGGNKLSVSIQCGEFLG